MSITELKGYEEFLRDLKVRIRSAQVRAALAVNSELVLLYWQIGRDILTRQEQEGWGAKVVERLAADLRREFPDMKGFSRANLMYMRSFAEAWDTEEIVQQLVGQIPWAPTIGLILCKDRKRLIAEYALKDLNKPVGVSEYQLVAAIPENLKGNLPTVEELEAELSEIAVVAEKES